MAEAVGLRPGDGHHRHILRVGRTPTGRTHPLRGARPPSSRPHGPATCATGPRTGEPVGELRIDGEVAETGEQQIDFLSGGETQEGAFVFSQPPTDENLTLRIASYKLP